MIYFLCFFSGELIGVQYLFRQTGQALQDMHPDSGDTSQLIEEHDMEDDMEVQEGFPDITDDPTVLDLEVHQAPASPTPGPSGVGSLTHSTSSLSPSLPSLAIATSIMGSSTFTLPLHTPTLAPDTPNVAPSALSSSSSFEAGVNIKTEEEGMVSINVFILEDLYLKIYVYIFY